MNILQEFQITKTPESHREIDEVDMQLRLNSHFMKLWKEGKLKTRMVNDNGYEMSYEDFMYARQHGISAWTKKCEQEGRIKFN